MTGQVNFVYNKCDPVHSLAGLAGKILHWSYGKVDMLCHNFHNIQELWKLKHDECWDVPPFIISKIENKLDNAISIKK